MSVVAFFSAKGAPGVTTTALLVAALWPRPVLLADCDPAGGDIALRVPGDDGRAVDASSGILSLLPLARRELPSAVLLDHAQTLLGGTSVLAGLPGPDQARVAAPLWGNLGTAFRSLASHDVILDCGRAHAAADHLALLAGADIALCVLRPNVSDVIQTRERLRELQSAFDTRETGVGRPGAGRLGAGGLGAGRLGFLVVADEQGNRRGDEALTLLGAALPRVTEFGRLEYDDRGASIFSSSPPARPERTALVRSGNALVSRLLSLLPEVRTSRAGGAA